LRSDKKDPEKMKVLATTPQFSLTSPVRRAVSPEASFPAQSIVNGSPRFGMNAGEVWKKVESKVGRRGAVGIGAGLSALVLLVGGVTCNSMRSTTPAAPTAQEQMLKKNDMLDNMMQVLKKPEAEKPAFLKPYLESSDSDVLQAGIRFVSTVKEPKVQAELLKPLTEKKDLPAAVRKTLVNIVSDIADPAIKADLLESLVKSGDYK
jgi:hypothetical protein